MLDMNQNLFYKFPSYLPLFLVTSDLTPVIVEYARPQTVIILAFAFPIRG